MYKKILKQFIDMPTNYQLFRNGYVLFKKATKSITSLLKLYQNLTTLWIFSKTKTSLQTFIQLKKKRIKVGPGRECVYYHI